MRRRWTPEEDAALREAYTGPGRAIDRALAALPGRSATAIYQRTHQLGLARTPRWTKADEEVLRELWYEHTALATIARRLKRSKLGVIHHARQIGLELGCPKGWEYIGNAAERTGFHPGMLMKILRAAGVTPRRAISQPTRTSKGLYTHKIVMPEDVDDAVALWMSTEPLHAAARRLGMTGPALERRLAAVGVVKPPELGRRHWRVKAEDLERALEVEVLSIVPSAKAA